MVCDSGNGAKVRLVPPPESARRSILIMIFKPTFPAVSGMFAALCSVMLCGAQDGAAASLRLIPHTIKLANGKSFSLNIPEGFDISVAAQGLRRVRFMTKAPDGRIFATDMYDQS